MPPGPLDRFSSETQDRHRGTPRHGMESGCRVIRLGTRHPTVYLPLEESGVRTPKGGTSVTGVTGICTRGLVLGHHLYDFLAECCYGVTIQIRYKGREYCNSASKATP